MSSDQKPMATVFQTIADEAYRYVDISITPWHLYCGIIKVLMLIAYRLHTCLYFTCILATLTSAL